MQGNTMNDRVKAGLGTSLHQGNLLNPGVRREIAGLNRLFLERAVSRCHADDPWFGLPLAASTRFADASPEAWERAIGCPVTLFELRLPAEASAVVTPDGVADASLEDPGGEARRAFGITALGVARRLGDGIPLATRIAFGLDAKLEAQVSRMSVADCYRIAAWPGLIRPRWSGHERFWNLFAEAVTRGEAVHWAYSAGLCLLAQCERQPTTVVYSSRARARPAHRRPDIPC